MKLCKELLCSNALSGRETRVRACSEVHQCHLTYRDTLVESRLKVQGDGALRALLLYISPQPLGSLHSGGLNHSVLYVPAEISRTYPDQAFLLSEVLLLKRLRYMYARHSIYCAAPFLACCSHTDPINRKEFPRLLSMQ